VLRIKNIPPASKKQKSNREKEMNIDPSKLKLAPVNAGDEKIQPGGNIRIPERLRKALGLESEAVKQLRSAQQERESAQKILSAWGVMVNDLCSKQERLKNAATQIDLLRNGIQKGREIVFEHLGSSGASHAEAAIQCAIRAVETELALPLLEESKQRIAEDLRAHITAMREFGKQNTIPSDVLASLPHLE
jgi:hypothetical protein